MYGVKAISYLTYGYGVLQNDTNEIQHKHTTHVKYMA